MEFSRLVAAPRALASFAHRAFGLPRRNRINLVSRPPNTGRAAGVPIYTAPDTPEEFRRLRIAAQADARRVSLMTFPGVGAFSP